MPDATTEIATPQRPASRAGEHEPVITGHGVGHDMRSKVRDDHRGNRDSPVTGVRLGRPEREPATALLAELPGNPDGTRLEVDIRPAQRGQLAAGRR